MIEFSSIKTLPSEHFIQAIVFFCRRNCFRKTRSAVGRPIGLLVGPILLVIVFYEPVLAQNPARIPKEAFGAKVGSGFISRKRGLPAASSRKSARAKSRHSRAR